jgi:Cu-Zn family superoxide dismutase
MKRLVLSVALMFVLPISAVSAGDHIKSASATIINKDGKEIGVANITQGSNGVLVHVKVSELTQGKHGLHRHSHGV